MKLERLQGRRGLHKAHDRVRRRLFAHLVKNGQLTQDGQCRGCWKRLLFMFAIRRVPRPVDGDLLEQNASGQRVEVPEV